MRGTAALLLCLTFWNIPATAQTRPGLKIVVIEGEGNINNILFGSAREPVVQVRDENDKPVTGARVTFTLPERGAGGTFFGTGNNLSANTNDQGRATGTGFRNNFVEGRFQIRVTATKGNLTGTTNINQTNFLPQSSNVSTDPLGAPAKPDKKFGRREKIIAVVAGGAIAGAIAAKKSGGSSAPPIPGTTITPGTITVGTPR